MVGTGTVRFYNAGKGFGFIAPEGGGSDVFVHVSAIETAGLESLNAGERLRYSTIADRQGRHAASDIQRI